MYTLFFMTLLICTEASEKKSFSFHPQENVLTDCIRNHLIIIDSRFGSTKIASDVAYLAAKRFHGKLMSSDAFNGRFNQFSFQLRSHVFNYELNKHQQSKQLQEILKQALIACADKRILSADLQLQSDELISFSENNLFLFQCVKSHLELTGRWEFYLQDGFTEFVASSAAEKYSGRSMVRKNFNRNIKTLFYSLRDHAISNKKSIDQLSHKVEISIKQAIEDCAMNKNPLIAVPTFEIETTEMAQLLNFVLVKWPNDLRTMIQSRSNRALLRRYSSDAWRALIREMSVCQNNTQIFRRALRSCWKNRAREIYDAHFVELPYIAHGYTLDYPTPHMFISDIESVIHRKNIKFSDRNPLVPRSYLNKLLNIRIPDRLNGQAEDDVYDDYINNGITSAEYYFENQINQFYRLLFFFLELRARSICNDEDDVFDGPLPNALIPEQIQAIIYDDNVYRDYLQDERHLYEMLMEGNTLNGIAQNLFESPRVLEENLLLLRSNIPSSYSNRLSSESASATSRKTTNFTTQSLKRKDNVWKNENGKCFSCKRAKTISFSFSNGSTNNLNPKNLDEVTRMSLEENPNFIDRPSTSMCSNLCASEEQNEIDTIELLWILHA